MTITKVDLDGSLTVIDEVAPSFLEPATLGQYEEALQSVVDGVARDQNFRDGVTLASYKDDPFEPWALQAQAFIAWRSGLWRYVYAEQAKFMAGERAQPTVEAFLLELPQIEWP